MVYLLRALKQLSFPLLLRVDYRSGLWSATGGKAQFWLLASTGLHLAVLYLFGQLQVMEVVLAVAFPAMFWRLPSPLVFSAAALNGSLTIASAGVVVLLLMIGLSPSAIEVAAYLVQFWGALALVKLVLNYIRTAKSDIPAPQQVRTVKSP